MALSTAQICTCLVIFPHLVIWTIVTSTMTGCIYHPIYELALYLPEVRRAAVNAFPDTTYLQNELRYVMCDKTLANICVFLAGSERYSKQARAAVMDLTVVMICFTVGLDDKYAFNLRARQVFGRIMDYDNDFKSKVHLSFQQCIRKRGIDTWRSNASRRKRGPRPERGRSVPRYLP